MTNPNNRPNSKSYPQDDRDAGEEEIKNNGNDAASESDLSWWEKLSNPDPKVREQGRHEWQEYQEEQFQQFHPLEEE